VTFGYPSGEFDDAVAAVCHGLASDDQVRALNELLRSDAAACDEYILRLELHSRLASEPDLFSSSSVSPVSSASAAVAPARAGGTRRGRRTVLWAFGLAASFALAATTAAWWSVRTRVPVRAPAPTSMAVALLSQTADAQWRTPSETPRLGAPLEPGWLRLEAGLAEVVLYCGARLVLEGPAELQLISATQVFCSRGRITAEVPPQARGFKLDTSFGSVTDHGSSFGVQVTDHETELHAFRGTVKLRTANGAVDQPLTEGSGIVIESSHARRPIAANRAAFASLFEVRVRSQAAEAQRFARWQASSERHNDDPSLLVRFDFEKASDTQWRLQNLSSLSDSTADATIVGCQWVSGRWPDKRALEFQGMSDRVRMNVPGEFDALTLATWVRVQGLDRELNSLFMSDGFDAGTVHWLIRHDGVLGLTIVGEGSGNFQIVASPAVLTLERFGMWIHLALVLDGRSGRVTHYVNGRPVGENALRIKPPYRIGTAELGNWNAKGFPKDDPFMIRNFSGAMDEFSLFSRAFDPLEIRALYVEGRPEPDAFVARD
jgi:hypothetical protein